jgi:DUF2934 family protein
MTEVPNIALRAYQLRDAAGRPEGRSDEFYFAAEEEFRLLIEKDIAVDYRKSLPFDESETSEEGERETAIATVMIDRLAKA